MPLTVGVVFQSAVKFITYIKGSEGRMLVSAHAYTVYTL